MFADNPDFFPTLRPIARKMYARITNQNAKYFLDPSAGKGDIADVIRRPRTYEEFCTENPEYAEQRRSDRGRSYFGSEEDHRVHIDVIENHPDLIQVLRGKKYDVVGYDWLTYEGVSYYDVILMNPPFSAGAAHLLKAWDFLHHGEIVCLLNEETINNPWTEERKRLVQIIQQFGDVEYLGDCFSTAERKTDVNVVMVYLKKVAQEDAPDLWARETTQEKQYDVEFDGDANMLAIRDNLANMEHWFNMANEHWIKGIEHIRKARLYMDQNKVRDSRDAHEDDFEKILGMALSNVHTSRAEFLRRHRKLAWTSVFKQMEFHRLLDSKQQDRFLRDVQRDSTIPFTAANIRSTLENVFLSRRKLFEESVANVFDELCSHAVENGSGPVRPDRIKNHRDSEGWKTNDNYKVNQRLVFPWGVETDFHGHLRQRGYGSSSSAVACTDLDRILCVLDGQNFDKCHTVGAAINGARPGELVESQYFQIRGYKKGTLHLKWKRLDLWEAFNRTAAAGKKWLGEDTQQYRPRKRREEPEWYCEHNGHKFVEGVCTNCGDPEVDEVAAVECEYCRAIFEHTGRQCCPIHPEPFETLALPADTGMETSLSFPQPGRLLGRGTRDRAVAQTHAIPTPRIMDDMTESTFENTRAALGLYDADAPRREALWNFRNLKTNEDVWAAERADNEALALVQEAFWKDTQAYNSRENCSHVDIEFMRRMVRKYAPAVKA